MKNEFKYRKCYNCDRTEFETFIHVNGLCAICQLLKDKRLVKKKDKKGVM